MTPDKALKGRLDVEIEVRNLSPANRRHEIDYSEYAVPPLALSGEHTVDIAMINGGHGWPTVFVDFCYLNMMLREGGIMVVDDIQAFPCAQLFLLLEQQPGWEMDKAVWQKTVLFSEKEPGKVDAGL